MTYEKIEGLAQRAVILRDLYHETMGKLSMECGNCVDWDNLRLYDFIDCLVLKREKDDDITYDGFDGIEMDDFIEHIRLYEKLDEKSYYKLIKPF